MLIIIEGPDKAGKTTLAKQIEERLGYRYVHFGAPGKDPAQDYADFLLNLKEPTVCDRFLYGEKVYGPMLRGKSLITPLQFTVLERLCRLKGAFLIKASTPIEIVQQRLIKDGDDMITAEQNIQASKMFDKVLGEANVISCSYTALSMADVGRSVDQLITPSELSISNAKIASRICTGIGTTTGQKVVFVGETLNKKVTWLGKPFDNGSSSEYLDDCIKLAGVDEKKVYVVNADTLTIDEVYFLHTTGCTHFIALGEIAEVKLRKCGVETYGKLPHPQYWKRFQSQRKFDYADMLRAIIQDSCKQLVRS